MTEQVTIRNQPERETFAESFLCGKIVQTTPELCAISVTVFRVKELKVKR